MAATRPPATRRSAKAAAAAAAGTADEANERAARQACGKLLRALEVVLADDDDGDRGKPGRLSPPRASPETGDASSYSGPPSPVTAPPPKRGRRAAATEHVVGISSHPGAVAWKPPLPVVYPRDEVLYGRASSLGGAAAAAAHPGGAVRMPSWHSGTASQCKVLVDDQSRSRAYYHPFDDQLVRAPGGLAALVVPDGHPSPRRRVADGDLGSPLSNERTAASALAAPSGVRDDDDHHGGRAGVSRVAWPPPAPAAAAAPDYAYASSTNGATMPLVREDDPCNRMPGGGLVSEAVARLPDVTLVPKDPAPIFENVINYRRVRARSRCVMCGRPARPARAAPGGGDAATTQTAPSVVGEPLHSAAVDSEVADDDHLEVDGVGGPAVPDYSGAPEVNDGEFAVIPKQNKDVCRACDRATWRHRPTGIVFKWCKGCKRFANIAKFKGKLHASKCDACRARGRVGYLRRVLKVQEAASAAASSLPPLIGREEDEDVEEDEEEDV